MRASPSVIIAAALIAAACSEAPRGEPEPLDLPDWQVCMEDYGGSGARLNEAKVRGDEAAMLCTLALIEGPGRDGEKLRLLYRLYRMREVEPEGLDARVRAMDRQELAARLRNAHMFSPELSSFESGMFGCPRYDPIARDLILRARPSEDMSCLPRGQR